MALPDEEVAQVRAATDMIGLVGEHTALKRVGTRYVGLCPFHTERSASFSVNAQEGLYYCFGCQASGDAISFVRAIEGCDFVEAVERLAARAGITVHHEENARAGQERGHRKQLYELLDAAVDFYHERLLHGRDAGAARQYLRSRGYDGDVVRQFKLGFAPHGYGELARHLRRPTALLTEAGLAWEGRSGPVDAFRERIIFPIFDPGGRAIALGGRILPDDIRRGTGDPGPKYRNSPESPIYSKRRTLYGLNWAKGDMARRGEAIVCEGYTDVIGFFRAGVPRAAATCGTSLTEDHFRLLANFAKRIVLAFDADAAGQNAAARLYEWERRHEIELAVAPLPAGTDPGELASSDPAALADAIVHARPFLGFQVDRAIAAVDLSNPEGRARAAEAALRAVAEHPSELVRDQYLVEIADKTRHDPGKLRPLLERLRREESARASTTARSPAREHARTRGRAGDEAPTPASGATNDEEWQPYDEPEEFDPDQPPSGRGPSRMPRDRSAQVSAQARRSVSATAAPRAGQDAIALAIHRPEAVAHLFHEVIFSDPIQRAAYRVLAEATELHEAIAASPPEVADLLRRLTVIDLESDADPEGTYIALVRVAAHRELVALNSEARQGGDGSDSERLRTVAVVMEDLEQLRDNTDGPVNEAGAIEAAGRLVAWLVRREGGRG